MSIEGLEDLAALVPEGMSGEALNYGQGEGQLRVNESVWGFYSDDTLRYYFILEEGVLSIQEASEIALGILSRINERWGSKITAEVEGIHNDDPDMSMLNRSKESNVRPANRPSDWIWKAFVWYRRRRRKKFQKQ